MLFFPGTVNKLLTKTVVINEQDQVVYQKRLPNDLSLIAQQLSSYRRSLEGIVVESTYNWYWLVFWLPTQRQYEASRRQPGGA